MNMRAVHDSCNRQKPDLNSFSFGVEQCLHLKLYRTVYRTVYLRIFGTRTHCELTDCLLAHRDRVKRNIGINVFQSCCSNLSKNENT